MIYTHQSVKPAPVCNYDINDAGKENLGYCSGVLLDGTSFEA